MACEGNTGLRNSIGPGLGDIQLTVDTFLEILGTEEIDDCYERPLRMTWTTIVDDQQDDGPTMTTVSTMTAVRLRWRASESAAK